MTYYLSECYRLRHDEAGRRYWLAQSALSDCRNAVTNQASLWTLADLVGKDGDLERSNRYIEYSWMCTTMFGGHTRSWQVSPVITTINNNYRTNLRRNNRNLRILLGAVSVMAVLLLASLLFLYKRNKLLFAARNELRRINGKLNHVNAQLNESNQQMKQVNAQLHDSNRVKDEYIGRFLDLCSHYIDKLDAYRLKVNRRLKANQLKELLRMTSSDDLRETETRELFANFDAAFLRLYPNFVEEFNALLRPEYHQQLGANSELTTDMRMAALIRLGIDDSARIASFLRLTPNTIYNYRARLKSHAAGSRDELEAQLKAIGLQHNEQRNEHS
ncbi:MAG: transcriptional regulator [Bacteroidales bacterium]|nr:transcriptional regulator [Bacteroidales bacterium]